MKIFYHVYSGKSIVAASGRLHVSQSAVSQSLQKLEDEINTPLFTRLHKKIIPTAAGEQLFRVVESFISELDICLNVLAHAKDVPSGELRIGSTPEFGKVYISMLAAEFRELYPEVTFSLVLGHPDKLLPMLQDGKIDFILLDEFLAKTPYRGNLDIFHFEPVSREDIILACSKPFYNQKINDNCSYSNLAKQDFITYTDDRQILNGWFKHHFNKSALKINTVMTVNDHEAVVSSIMNKIGMGVVSSQLVKNYLDSGQLVKIETSKPDIVNTISLVQLLDKVPILAEKLFTRFLVEKIQIITAD